MNKNNAINKKSEQENFSYTMRNISIPISFIKEKNILSSININSVLNNKYNFLIKKIN